MGVLLGDFVLLEQEARSASISSPANHRGFDADFPPSRPGSPDRAGDDLKRLWTSVG
jgi:hypothetical protein